MPGNRPFLESFHFVRHKSEALGKQVVPIDPHHASQTCSRCGHVSPNNRAGRQFECVRCGFTPDADLNAGRLHVSEPNAASGEAEGREAIEAGLSCKPVRLLVSG